MKTIARFVFALAVITAAANTVAPSTTDFPPPACRPCPTGAAALN